MSATPAKLYVPQDSAAVAVGANEVAIRLQNAVLAGGKNATVLRNSSRGLFWLEPLLEVQTPQGRLGFGPVAPEAVQSLVDAGVLDLESNPSALDCQKLTNTYASSHCNVSLGYELREI